VTRLNAILCYVLSDVVKYYFIALII